jgi:hypothetical protein
MTGLNFLLTKRLTTELVGPEVLLTTLEELEAKMRSLNFDLSSLDPNTIYQLPSDRSRPLRQSHAPALDPRQP